MGGVTVYHGTIGARAEKIRREGVRQNEDGVCYGAGNLSLAGSYAALRTSFDMLHFGGENRGLVVVAEIPRERLIRLPWPPPEGRPRCIGWRDGYHVKEGIHAHEIVDMLFGHAPRLATPEGMAEVYRRHIGWQWLLPTVERGDFAVPNYDEHGNPV